MLIDIPIEIIKLEDASYHVMIEALFANAVPGSLIIDTGASKTVLDLNFVKHFATDVSAIDELDSSGINAMIEGAKIGTIPHINLKNLEIKDYTCMLLDLSHINEIYKRYSDKQIAGLIGSDFLVNYEAVIDYGQKRLSLNY